MGMTSRIAMWVSLLCLLSTSATAQQTIPVTLEILELWQESDVDGPPAPPSLADLYPIVSIDGQAGDARGFICDNPGVGSGYILPFQFFSETAFLSGCANLPWTFTIDVPAEHFDDDGVPIRIQIMDDDTFFDNEVALIDLVLYADGTWDGDASWPQNCNHETTLDAGARVCWHLEGSIDSDGDGISDAHEQLGIDTDGDGAIDLDLPALGADPLHKDVFLEIDWTADNVPTRASVQGLKTAFAAAPIDAGGVANPDGQPGIDLHVDTGSLVEDGLLVGDDFGGGNPLPPSFPVCNLYGDMQGDYFPARAANFDAAERGSVFHYAILSKRCCMTGSDYGMRCSQNSDCADGALCTPAGGIGLLGRGELIVWNSQTQGASLMHELGHNFGLRHGGDVEQNCKPNYISVMNYDQAVLQRIDGSVVLDYSPVRQSDGRRGSGRLPDLAEDDLSETPILDPLDQQNFVVYTDLTQHKRRALVGSPINWTGEDPPVSSPTPVTVNIDLADIRTNAPSACLAPENLQIRTAADPLTGHDDWSHLRLPFRSRFGVTAFLPPEPLPPEPTDEETLAHMQALNTADLHVIAQGPAGPYEAGAVLDLARRVRVDNEGPNPALVVALRETFPVGSSLAGLPPACSENPASTLACRLPAILDGGTTSLDFTVRTLASCSNGLPVPIVSRADVSNVTQYAGTDPDGGDNSHTLSIPVVDTSAPSLSLSAQPPRLWPPNHKMVSITVAVTATDACDPNPGIRLVSIASNQPTDGAGDGSTSPDVDGAAFGTDDRTFRLRAERRGGATRVYTIAYEVRDASGNASLSTTAVEVPANQR
jgi:hypothetical protein